MTLFWEPLDWDCPLTLLSVNSNACYGSFHGRDALVLYDGNITLIYTFIDVRTLSCVSSAITTWANKKILHLMLVNNEIFMLDEVGDLHRLKKSSDGEMESSHQSTSVANKQWCWSHVQHFDGALAITDIKNGMALLRHDENNSFIEIYKSGDSDFDLLWSKKLSYSQISKRLQLIHLNTNIIGLALKKSLLKDLALTTQELIFLEKPTGFISVLPVSEKFVNLIDIYYDKDVLITVAPMQNCIALAYHSGKLVFVTCDESSRTLTCRVLFLPEKLLSAVWYENNGMCLIWTDGFNLRHSKILDYSEVIHLKVERNIKGVRHLLKIDEWILGAAQNGCFYKIEISEFGEEVEKTESSQILRSYYEVATFIDRINERISLQEQEIDCISIAESEDARNNLLVTLKERELCVENKTGFVFKKSFWRFRIEGKSFNKNFVEVKILPDDLRNNAIVRFEVTFLSRVDCQVLGLSFVADFGQNFKLLQIRLPEVIMKERRENESDLHTKLREIAGTRNPYFKETGTR